MFLLYNFWYSKLVRAINHKLAKNEQLPSFYLTNTNGNKVNSDDFRGQPTILMFFRGNWCPLCMAQIKEIAGYYQQLSDLGAKIVLISPQPEKNTQALATKFNVDFYFMTDVNNEAAKSLGIEMENGLPMGMEVLGYQKDTVLPTVLITDRNGKIIYSDLTDNYRIRPEPKAFIKVLNEQV
jgi:peroxiredoxin